MKIKSIVGENGALAALCARGACPAAIIVENERSDDVFVQGYVPDAGEKSQLTAPEGEGFVKMSRKTFEKIARQVLGS